MHVHMPKPLHGWRAFVGEVAIIVLGVLIALAAEQAVQSIEWREKVGSALSDMNNELGSGDGPQAYGRLAIHDCIANDLNSLRSSVEKGDRSATRKGINQFWVPNRTWDSLARDAATAADVAAHMSHERMLQYRIAYEMVPAMQRLAEKELADTGRLRALPSSGGPISANEKLAVLDAVEALKVDNDTFARESRFLLIRMRMMDIRLNRNFVARDLSQAHSHYGACLSDPRLALPTGMSLASLRLE